MDERRTGPWAPTEARPLLPGGPQALVEPRTAIRGKRVYSGLHDIESLERTSESPIAGKMELDLETTERGAS